jgi:hypothetical protein
MACGYEEERGRVLKIRSCGECGEDPELKRLQIAESFGGLKALRSLLKQNWALSGSKT